MSNHAGSYLLNKVLHLLEDRGLFAQLGPEKACKLVLDILRLSDGYDCNPGEILDKIGDRLGICSWCLTAKPDIVKGMCASCRERESPT